MNVFYELSSDNTALCIKFCHNGISDAWSDYRLCFILHDDKALNKHAENVLLCCFTSTVNSCGHIVAVN